jgi:SNF2 family DNA or RNA helicase
VILDEAQNIKNPATRQAQVARKLPAQWRAALTGTPVENRLSELWSIVHFLNPGYLGSEENFRHQLANPIERAGDPVATQKLKNLVGPFILRRVKSDPAVISDLPQKNEIKVYCNLTREQATLYQAVVRDHLERIAAAEGIDRRGHILAMLMKLKQVCNHPAQFLADGSRLAGRSGKLARLSEMLDEVRTVGERALIFTQFAAMGGMLQDYMQETFLDEVLFLHGGTPAKARDRMVDRFQNDPQGPLFFILSIKAGGTGLNLMRANHVFHFDRWWNPAVENQATDRAFRIGQTRNVQVYKYLCVGTFEEKVDDLLERKKALAEAIVGKSEAWITELSTEQLRDLFVLRKEALGDE